MATGALLTSSLNLLSGLVALLTSYYAYRSNRLVGNPVLRAISIGFMLLGVGLVFDAGTTLVTGRTLVESFAERVLVLVASFTYLTVQMVAYLVIALAYARVAYSAKASSLAPLAVAGTAAIGLFTYSVLSYFVVLILLAFVVFQGVLLRSGERKGFSTMVLLGFSLILSAHVVLLASVLTLRTLLFLLGTGVQFLGFVCLLVFVVRSEVVGSG